ncbi:type II secretion system protein N [Luteimonas sp. SJ-92]|uniref:Type II secretion system protein N n=1 Tax=Luteimonas salinisoli TaxID=2752307 RepID=A0A853JBH2_9GAMM|nr:type II secretion system protein N [Luteimonas salinisoli]NZA26596.1 type II secretion system protein N [Luteimonas salinisoli]
MSARGLAWLFALALPPMLGLSLPLRLALGLSDLEQAGLGASAASGSLWQGRLHDARLHGRALGDVGVRLSPWPLLTGTRELVVRGATLRASLLQGARRGIRDANGTLVLEDPGLAPGLAVVLDADAARLVFAGDACRSASGRIGLALHPAAGGDPLAVFEGTVACDGRAATVAWTPSGTAPGPFAGLRIDARLEPDGAWRLRSVVPRVDDARDAAALELAGFRAGPAGWSRTDSGSFP